MTNEPMKAIDHTPRKNAPALIEEYRRGTIVAADGGRSARTEADGPPEDEPMSAIGPDCLGYQYSVLDSRSRGSIPIERTETDVTVAAANGPADPRSDTFGTMERGVDSMAAIAVQPAHGRFGNSNVQLVEPVERERE
jgi:hypothetical protein